MRLSDIPDDVMEQIKEFISENKKKYPVTSSDPNITLVKKVEEKFGYKLSPQQIYSIAKGEQTVRVKLSIDTVKQLEKRYGSVGEGVKHIVKTMGKGFSEPPAILKPAIDEMKGKELTYSDMVKILADLKYSDPDRIIRELFQKGYAERKGDKFIVHDYAIDPQLKLIAMLYGL